MTLLMLLVFLMFGTRPPITSVASAQATPGWSPITTECTVQPRTLAGLNEIASTGGTPVSDEAVPYVQPSGSPAPAQTVEAVTATVEQFVACVNEGDFLRFVALFSDDFIRNNAEDIELPLADDDPLLTPSPVAAEDHLLIDEITDLIELPDGRVNALFTILSADDSEEPVSIQVTLGYDQDRERWMIDDFRELIPQEGSIPWTLVQGEGYEGVIVPPVSAAELTDFFVSGPVQELWIPTEEEIAELEQTLPGYLQDVVPSMTWVSDDFIDRLPEYKRQYAGFVQDGRRLILVNATCAGDDMQWQRNPVIVMDGGDCFFRVTYDPATGTFSEFQVNGEA